MLRLFDTANNQTLTSNNSHRPSSIVHRPRLATPTVLVLAGIVLAAACLRFYGLDSYGLWYDEVASVDVAQRGVASILTGRFGWMLVQTPLHYLLVWLTIQPLDPTTTAVLVRLPSVLAGLLLPLAMYGLGKEMFGRAQGMVGALMVALSAVVVSHSQDARPYIFLALFTTLSVYCLLVAERTGSRRWWLLFALSTAANLLMTYHAATLAMPALAPYLLWVLYCTWRKRAADGGGELRSAAISLLIIVAVGVLVLIDLLQVPRLAPNMSLVSPSSIADQLGRMLNSFGLVGIERSAEINLQWVVGCVALLGASLALWERRFRAVALCLLMLVVPTMLMAVLKTTNTVFQRYVLFALPFYFLLIANVVVGLPPLISTLSRSQPWAGRLAGGLRGALSAALVGVMCLGLYVYFKPELHRQLSYLPDYRSAAQYLATTATHDDIIVVLDEPPQSLQVFDFYWHSTPPAPIYSALDPRLSLLALKGNIYWVLSYQQNDPAYITRLQSAAPSRFRSVQSFDRLLVAGQSGSLGIEASLREMSSRLNATDPEFGGSIQPLNTLYAALEQAHGDTQAAAQAYRTAGPYYLSGDEYLSTAEGFSARGETAAAWREAIMSLFMEPYKPEIHSFLSQLLAKEGYTAQSDAERQIAAALK